MYRHILVGTDGSTTAAQAVDRAVCLAAAVGARLTILTVTDGSDVQGVDGQGLVDAEVARHGDVGVEITALAVDGDPASVLIDTAASGGHDLLVVGNRGMTGPGRYFLGSVPNKVSHHAPCNLLVVRTT